MSILLLCMCIVIARKLYNCWEEVLDPDLENCVIVKSTGIQSKRNLPESMFFTISSTPLMLQLELVWYKTQNKDTLPNLIYK